MCPRAGDRAWDDPEIPPGIIDVGAKGIAWSVGVKQANLGLSAPDSEVFPHVLRAVASASEGSRPNTSSLAGIFEVSLTKYSGLLFASSKHFPT